MTAQRTADDCPQSPGGPTKARNFPIAKRRMAS
jgi:hypothetical protein